VLDRSPILYRVPANQGRASGVLQEASGEEAGEVDGNRRIQIERPAELEVDLIIDVSRAAGIQTVLVVTWDSLHMRPFDVRLFGAKKSVLPSL
jgi:hypothetical protein